MVFYHDRSIRFRETDAAGVVYFTEILNLCHEAYEESLAQAGIDVRHLFSPQGIALPIKRATVDFWRPLFCGDRLRISLEGQAISASEFDLHYHLYRLDGGSTWNPTDRPVAQAQTVHVCIRGDDRQRRDLPEDLQSWLCSLA